MHAPIIAVPIIKCRTCFFEHSKNVKQTFILDSGEDGLKKPKLVSIAKPRLSRRMDRRSQHSVHFHSLGL